MATEADVYRSLQKHLDKMPVGYPATKSGVEISLLKRIFTVEQAAIATHLDYKHKTVDQVFEKARADIGSKADLKRVLDETVSNGGIIRRRRDGREEYALLPLLLWGMYEHQLKRLNPAFLSDFGQYMMGEFGLELATSRLPKMRVVPIEESVEAKHRIATYDEMRHLIALAGEQIAIQECLCRKVSDMQGKPCQATERREVCMSLGDLADLYVEEGWGRRISPDEALEMVRQNEEQGLVLMPGNEQEPNFVCACCSDCCSMLSMMSNFPKPAEVVASNFYAQVDTELCRGCGTCAERCPLEAVGKTNGHSAVDLKRCIGCGLCVPTCPESAMHLVRKDKEVIPPRTAEELYDTVLAQKSTLAGRMRDYSMKAFLRVVSRLSR
jgi:Pyruvate/2-oxoacid:ferredoxin oxidoreductase delta subunit